MEERSFEEEKENLKIEHIKAWSSYFGQEAQRMETFMRQFGIEKTDLPKTCEKYLDILVDLGQELGLEKLNESTYMMAIMNLYKEKFERETKYNESTKEISDLNNKLLDLNLFHDTLIRFSIASHVFSLLPVGMIFCYLHIYRDIKMLELKLPEEQQELSETEVEMQYMQNKLEQYKTNSEKYKAFMNSIEPNLKHDSLIEEYQKMKTFETMHEKLKKELDTYQDLPPNFTMAKLKLQEMKDEIKKVEKEIEEKVQQLA